MVLRPLLLTLLSVLFATTSFAASFSMLTTSDVSALLNEDNVIFVDARDPNAFNGWAMQNEKRTGHLPKATNLAADWITRDLPRTAEIAAAKKLSKADQLVVYGYTTAEARIVADWLVTQGISEKRIALYSGGFAAWAETDLPLLRLNQYELIVPVQWVEKQIDTKNTMIVEASWGEGKVYKRNHIPGAIHLNTDLVESGDLNWNFFPQETIKKNLLALGITADTRVILYGEAGIDAARAAVAMMAVGVKDVRIINGGLHAWKAAGYPTERGEVEPVAASNFGDAVARPELVIQEADAKRILAAPDAELVSIRSWPEYIGETTGYSYIKPKGRIKGAVWGHAGKDAYNMDDFRNPDQTMRDYHEIEAFWKDWGITPDKEVSFYCGTGWRASETLIYAMAMGYKRASLFDDGWNIWSMNPDNPIVIGEAK